MWDSAPMIQRERLVSKISEDLLKVLELTPLNSATDNYLTLLHLTENKKKNVSDWILKFVKKKGKTIVMLSGLFSVIVSILSEY